MARSDERTSIGTRANYRYCESKYACADSSTNPILSFIYLINIRVKGKHVRDFKGDALDKIAYFNKNKHVEWKSSVCDKTILEKMYSNKCFAKDELDSCAW